MKRWYCVLNIESGVPLYCGTNERKTAKALVKGTHYGFGESDATAIRHAHANRKTWLAELARRPVGE